MENIVEEKYKMECYSSGDLVYLNDSFEVYFDNEESMLQLVNDLPASYIKKKYKKDHSGTWVRIYFNNE